MTTMKFNGKLLMALAVALLTSLAFHSCDFGDDEGEDGGGDPQTQARALQVSIDETELTDEDIYIGDELRHEKFGKVKVKIEDLPVSVAELKKLKLPNGMTDIHQSPYLQPILLVAALNQLNYDKTEAKKMIDYVAKVSRSEQRDGVTVYFPSNEAVTNFDKTEWDQVIQYKKWDKVRSWLDGAVYANNYNPAKPYTMTIELKNNSYGLDKFKVKLWLTSTQLASQRGMDVLMYDSDSNGVYDTFWTDTFRWMVHSLGEY